jgi:hypothetical protein
MPHNCELWDFKGPGPPLLKFSLPTVCGNDALALHSVQLPCNIGGQTTRLMLKYAFCDPGTGCCMFFRAESGVFAKLAETPTTRRAVTCVSTNCFTNICRFSVLFVLKVLPFYYRARSGRHTKDTNSKILHCNSSETNAVSLPVFLLFASQWYFLPEHLSSDQIGSLVEYPASVSALHAAKGSNSRNVPVSSCPRSFSIEDLPSDQIGSLVEFPASASASKQRENANNHFFSGNNDQTSNYEQQLIKLATLFTLGSVLGLAHGFMLVRVVFRVLCAFVALRACSGASSDL